jgi:2-enoate reductase
LNYTKVIGYDDHAVKISRHISKGVPNPYNTWQPILPENIENPLAPKIGPETVEETLPADLVVLALGGKPDDRLYYEAKKTRIADEIFNIGDSFSAGKVLEATRAAQALAAAI